MNCRATGPGCAAFRKREQGVTTGVNADATYLGVINRGLNLLLAADSRRLGDTPSSSWLR